MTVIAVAGLQLTTVRAETEIPDEVFITEAQHGTCTLAATAMVIRARMYLSGSDEWFYITDTSIRDVAWTSSGLWYGFTVRPSEDEYISINHFDLGGISVEALKELLDEHPEGITLYCGSVPHALHLTDYEGNEFFCADPAYSFDDGNERINIMDSLVGQYFSSVEGVLGDAIGVWYVSDYYIIDDRPETNGLPVMLDDETIREII